MADVYDLYVTSDLDVGFYVAEAGKVREKVLELMCGTGRVSVPLLEAGVDLTCVDASEVALLVRRLLAQPTAPVRQHIVQEPIRSRTRAPTSRLPQRRGVEQSGARRAHNPRIAD